MRWNILAVNEDSTRGGFVSRERSLQSEATAAQNSSCQDRNGCSRRAGHPLRSTQEDPSPQLDLTGAGGAETPFPVLTRMKENTEIECLPMLYFTEKNEQGTVIGK